MLLIKVLWNRLRKDKAEATRKVPSEAPAAGAVAQQPAVADLDSSPVAAGQAVPGAPASARVPLSAERAQVLEQALLARGLTERERVIVMGVYAGKTHAALAEELFLSRSTVGTYCRRAYEKLGVADKAELVSLLDGIEG